MRREDQEVFLKVVILSLRLEKGWEFKFREREVELGGEERGRDLRQGNRLSDARSGSDSVLLE